MTDAAGRERPFRVHPSLCQAGPERPRASLKRGSRAGPSREAAGRLAAPGPGRGSREGEEGAARWGCPGGLMGTVYQGGDGRPARRALQRPDVSVRG